MRDTLAFPLLVLIISSACASAQAAPPREGGLRAAVDRYGAQVVRALSRREGQGYKAYETKTFYGDVDRDGDSDAVVELSFCEAQGCRPTSQTSNIAVFLKGRGGYRLAAGKSFIKYNEDNSVEMLGKVGSVRGGTIHAAVYGCEVDDEVCLPKYLYHAIYSFRRGRLVMERAHVRGR